MTNQGSATTRELAGETALMMGSTSGIGRATFDVPTLNGGAGEQPRPESADPASNVTAHAVAPRSLGGIFGFLPLYRLWWRIGL